MIDRQILASLTPDEMPTDQLKLVAQMVGVENVIKLMLKFRGQYLHFPSFWQANIVQKWVSHKYPEHDVNQLATDLDVSEQTIRRAISKKKVRGPWKAPKKTVPEQLNLLP